MAIIYIQKKDNGLLLRREVEEGDEDIGLGFSKEVVLEESGGDFEAKIGRAILSLFKKPRKSPVRKGAAE